MLKPAYQVKIGSETYDSTNNAEALSINVDCDINIPLDEFRIVLRHGDKVPIRTDDRAVIELGYEDSLKKVFTGAVDTVEPGISSVIVNGYSAAAPLTRIRTHQIYEKQTAGAIVKDLAGKANLRVKTAEDGISFPMYVVDESRPLYGHMRELAGLCGFDLFMTPDGEVMFKKYQKKKAVPFTYGQDIVAMSARSVTPPATSVKVFEESPSSFKGADTAHWLSKKVIGGTSGSGDQVHIINHPAIRDKDTADKVAVAALETLSVSKVGVLRTMGEPAVGLGDTIEVKEMPDARMNDTFEVTRVSHAFNMDEGFVTTFGWIKKPSGP
jgi:phage protein D